MPAATRAIARDEMLARLTAALAASSYEDIVIIHDDVAGDPDREAEDPPEAPSGKPWLRVQVRHADGEQASLGSINGKRRQEQTGLVTVQVFTPYGNGLGDSDALADIILDAFRTGGQTPSGVQFRNGRAPEQGRRGLWFQVNCIVEFTYDLIR